MPPEIVYVNQPLISCDGNNEAAGHPKIYLNLGKQGKGCCPYCYREFVLRSHDSETDCSVSEETKSS